MEKLKRSSRSDELKQKKKKRTRNILVLLIILIVALLAMIVIYINNNQSLNAFKIEQTVELSNTENCSFVSYKNGIVKFNRDGAQAITSDGKQLWTISYNLKEPIADVNGSYVAIGELNGKTVYVINGSGEAKEITVPYPVVEVEVAAQGVCAILVNNGTQDFIYFYTLDSSDYIAYIKTVTSQDGFPVDMSLSEDGKKLVTTYVKADSDSIASEITFHNLGDVGKNYLERLVGAYPLSNEFVAQVEFISNDLLVAFKDNGFYMYSFKEVPSEVVSETYDSAIINIFNNANHVGLILEDTSSSKKNRVIVYHINGKKVMDTSIDFSYEKIVASQNYIVFYDSVSCHVMNFEGKLVFCDTFTEKINQMYAGSTSWKFITLTDIAMNTIQMVETKEE